MNRKIREWISIHIAKNPGKVLLLAILMFNILFLLISALIISGMSLSGTEHMTFLEAAFCTVTMILDPGCIQFVVADIGHVSVGIVIICLLIIVIGMISFTGAVIGYITNYISGFIATANAGKRELHISNHFVILNWNTRASEIINDLLFCEKKEKVVVLVSSGKEEIEKEIEARLSDTEKRENFELRMKYQQLNPISRWLYFHRHRFKQRVTVIVREGDVFSAKQLHDISLERAKIVIILGNDDNNTICKYEKTQTSISDGEGNSHTIKTLMQVADITSAEYSDNNQKIVVEITDKWTGELVQRIIECKQVEGKCNIIPVDLNRVLGQILSQFSLMPELNYAYRELFSNKGATFYACEDLYKIDAEFISDYLNNHVCAIPLTHLKNNDGKVHAYYIASDENDIHKTASGLSSDYRVILNRKYWIEKKTVIILGHNSRCADIMEGFFNFRTEWNYPDGSEILSITIIDDEENLKKMDYYKNYPFVSDCVAASIYDREIICSTIEKIVSSNTEDTSILILSDDMAPNQDIDAQALANLVYVQDIINKKKKENSSFDVESIDVIVEIIDPKHYDVVNSYSVNNVVISNRYISKMITQIGEKEALFEFYQDMLTYDADLRSGYESKEIYAKKVSSFFEKLPAVCHADELIRAVFYASISEQIPLDQRYPTIVLGYVKPGGKICLFEGDLSKISVKLSEKDKIIVYSIH